MAQNSPAHLDLVKRMNQKNIRNLLRQDSPKSIATLACQASLSYPTVASLLKELMLKGEVIKSKNLESCGGRPGIQYELDIRFQHGLMLYFKELSLIGKVYNVYGQVVEEYIKEVSSELTIDTVIGLVTAIRNKYPRITVISIGIPGVVKDNNILSLPRFPKLQGIQLGQKLIAMFQAEVFMENDLNAIAMAEIKENHCFAHIAYSKGCIGTGIAINGEVYTGYSGYAGELEYLFKDTNDLEDNLMTCILSLICVFNQPFIYLSGEEITENLANTITNRLKERIPLERIPQIQVKGDLDSKYEEGLRKRILQYWDNKID